MLNVPTYIFQLLHILVYVYVYVTINCNYWIMINNSTTVNEDEISWPLLILQFGNYYIIIIITAGIK